ncbi:MAG TPA: HNH endonuclease family protein [Gordonia sp. (in: high G+C Gram-positive bacteria)]|uniref:HNH endonuclease family protein n=1 Tax=unclassified Gordonia (in: high G+C Gram-positive bacteria) TaxID=2657482 RepID=UPI000FB60605|nr:MULTISPECIES: HNH endonuclease family protein [unclassified Gordonia (in: high G+C Gram-positive bacteria)]RUP41562.1 MAG: HNH endonuclease [Gordonia sp. (in: high G+C Gram-positive bacteria)]HNP56651.1 HNH endonuclease family protein [Gordonia sp. (in: high G+C Gram-positive bacteria)]HRC50321.1 HNH endonuclease family protein [Gordonia sp. (in: high G+C Gram-positive bacteria)]
MRTTMTWRLGVGAAVTWTMLTACSLAPAPADTEAAPTPPSARPPSSKVSPIPPSETASPQVAAMAAKALAQLDRIPVKGSAPKTGYHRSVFGRAWSDDVTVDKGHNGCKTRDDVLQRDLTDVVMQGKCRVMSGWLDDPYTGERLRFERGVDVYRIQIDHVVALGDAWRTGAQQWTPEKRLDFANDLRNLQATAGWANQQKKASNAASWLPPNRSYRCTYVARQVKVKAAYGLWVVPAERDAMRRVLAKCAP